MSEVTPPTTASVTGPRMEVAPGWLGAWRGIWLLTWRSQLSWRRLGLSLALLLALPVLVYLTTVAPEKWREHERTLVMGSAGEQVHELSRHLFQAGCPLKADQRGRVFRIFREEFSRTDRESAGSAPSEASRKLAEQVKAAFERVTARISTVLDEPQVVQFRVFAKRQVALRQERANEPQWGRATAFYRWLIDLYFFVILPLNCIRACGPLIRDEVQADTLGYLVTRPVGRAGLLVLKYLSQTAWLQLALLAETLMLFGAGLVRQIPELGVLLPLFLAAQFLAVPAWSALGLLLGQLSNRYMAVAVLYGLIVEMGIGSIPTNINTLSLVRHLKTLLAHNAALKNIYQWTGTGVPLAVAALLLATAGFLTAAALLFRFKEYHHTAEMQK